MACALVLDAARAAQKVGDGGHKSTKREKVVANPEIFWRTIGLLFKIWPYAASFFEL